MTEPDSTAVLPPELLVQVFEELTDIDLRSVMLVCMRWREIGMDCRSYWQHIELDSTAPGPLTLFHRLLQRTKGRPFCIFMGFSESNPLLPSVVFPALAEHLHLVVSLHLRLTVALCSEIFQFLRRPAPLLRVFQLGTTGYISPEAHLAEVPADIFANHPGSLNTVRLYNVLLPATNAPPAFRNVVFVKFNLDDRALEPAPDVFFHFPKVKYVWFWGLVFLDSPAYFDAKSVAQLKWLQLDLSFYPDGLTWRMPLYTVAHVTVVVYGSPWELTGMLGHVQGPLQLAFRGRSYGDKYGDFFTMIVGDLDWRRSRTFIVRWEHWLGRDTSAEGEHLPEPSIIARIESELFFSTFSTVNRIESLTVPHNLLDSVIKAFPALPNVAELRVVARGRRDFPFPEFLESDHQMMLPFPRLQRLILHSSARALKISTATFITFASRVIPPSTLPLPVLALENVTLEIDDPSVFWPYFTAVERGGSWQYPFGFANPKFSSPHRFEDDWL